MAAPRPTTRNPWAWVSTLYLAEGLPYVVVMTVAVILYKGLGMSNTDIALYTSWLYLPWVIKPLWSPVVDILKTRRTWIWAMQLVLGGGLAGVALSLPTSRAFQYSLAFFWLLAFSSATHDIAIDGFYLLATTEKEQSFFVGIRSTFYRIAMIAGQGLLVMLVGAIQDNTGLPKVQLQINATPLAALVQSISPHEYPSAPPAGELRVISDPPAVQIAPVPRSKSEIKTLLALVKTNNLAHGFYSVDKPSEEGWFSRNITRPLGRFFGWPFRIIGEQLEPILRAHFGREIVQTDVAGNIGILSLHLSKPPGKDVVVTLGTKVSFGFGANDDKLFSIAEGSRFVFNDTNWNQPALAVIQLDPKLNRPAQL